MHVHSIEDDGCLAAPGDEADLFVFKASASLPSRTRSASNDRSMRSTPVYDLRPHFASLDYDSTCRHSCIYYDQVSFSSSLLVKGKKFWGRKMTETTCHVNIQSIHTPLSSFIEIAL